MHFADKWFVGQTSITRHPIYVMYVMCLKNLIVAALYKFSGRYPFCLNNRRNYVDDSTWDVIMHLAYFFLYVIRLRDKQTIIIVTIIHFFGKWGNKHMAPQPQMPRGILRDRPLVSNIWIYMAPKKKHVSSVSSLFFYNSSVIQ